jgi:hypothetical protein
MAHNFEGAHSQRYHKAANQESLISNCILPKMAIILLSAGSTQKHVRTQLPQNFKAGKNTVICGRGNACTRSTGNRFLNSLVYCYLKTYAEARNKIEKSSIVSAIIAEVKQESPHGAGFVKFQGGAWYEVEDAFAREKIGCLFRDALHTQYRSSTKAKLARRKAEKKEAHSSSNNDHGSISSSSSYSSSASSYFITPLAEKIFGDEEADNSVSLLPEIIQSASCHQMVPNRNMNDYCSLLSNYLCQQDPLRSRPRPDFLQSCMPGASSTLVPENKLTPTSVLSAVQDACDLIDDIPDDILVIFEGDF